jgi:hypothetical protein
VTLRVRDRMVAICCGSSMGSGRAGEARGAVDPKR